MAKTANKKKTKGSGKRELIAPKGDKRYIRRDSKGRIKESDDQSRSLSKDRQTKPKRRQNQAMVIAGIVESLNRDAL